MNWEDLQAFAVIELKLSRDDFWALTTPEFIAMRSRWMEREKRTQIRLATIITEIGNVFRKKPATPQQRFPDLFDSPATRQSPEQLRNIIRAFKSQCQ